MARFARRSLLLLTTASASALAGCSWYAAPRFTVVGVQEASRSEQAVVLRFTVEAENRNSEPLPLRQASYALNLDGRRVFAGSRSAEVTVGSFDRQSFTLPAVVPIEDAGALLADSGSVRYALTGAVEYLTPGQLAEVLFDSGLRRTKASLSARGEITLD